MLHLSINLLREMAIFTKLRLCKCRRSLTRDLRLQILAVERAARLFDHISSHPPAVRSGAAGNVRRQGNIWEEKKRSILAGRFGFRYVQDSTKIDVPGFYDGDVVYRVRFMPDNVGEWIYLTGAGAFWLRAFNHACWRGQNGTWVAPPPPCPELTMKTISFGA